jgi:hypothetical protein
MSKRGFSSLGLALCTPKLNFDQANETIIFQQNKHPLNTTVARTNRPSYYAKIGSWKQRGNGRGNHVTSTAEQNLTGKM